MNTIISLDNIGGNLMTKNYYKWNEENLMCDLNNEDYNIVISNTNTLNLTFPLGLNGIISPVYSYTNNKGFNLQTIINIIEEYYENEITEEEKNLLIVEEVEDLSISSRIDLLDYSNLCFFQGIKECEGVYNILLGS